MKKILSPILIFFCDITMYTYTDEVFYNGDYYEKIFDNFTQFKHPSTTNIK